MFVQQAFAQHAKHEPLAVELFVPGVTAPNEFLERLMIPRPPRAQGAASHGDERYCAIVFFRKEGIGRNIG